MTDEFDIKIGDQVQNGKLWLTVRKIMTQDVKSLSKGTIIYHRLYFTEPHAPIWSYEVKQFRNGNSDTVLEHHE